MIAGIEELAVECADGRALEQRGTVVDADKTFDEFAWPWLPGARPCAADQVVSPSRKVQLRAGHGSTVVHAAGFHTRAHRSANVGRVSFLIGVPLQTAGFGKSGSPD